MKIITYFSWCLKEQVITTVTWSIRSILIVPRPKSAGFDLNAIGSRRAVNGDGDEIAALPASAALCYKIQSPQRCVIPRARCAFMVQDAQLEHALPKPRWR